MATKKKLLEAAAGAAGGAGIDEPLGVVYTFDDTTNKILNAIASDADGNTIIGGEWDGNSIVSKLDTDFSTTFTKVFDDGGSAAVYGVAADSSGNIYSVSHGNQALNQVGDYDLCMYKLNSSGTYQAGMVFGNVYEDRFLSIKNTLKIDSNDQLSVNWNYEPTATASDGVGAVGVLATDLNPSDTVRRRYCYNTQIEEQAISHTVLSDGDIIQVSKAALLESGGTRNKLLVTRYDADFTVSANIVWQATIDAGLTINLNYTETGCGVDSSDNIYIGTNLTSSSTLSYEGVLIKLDSNGNLVWAKTATNSDKNNYKSTAVSSNGDIYVHVYPADETAYHSYVQKWNADGTLDWVKRVSYQGDKRLVLNTDPNGDVLLGWYGTSAGGKSLAAYKFPSDADKWPDVCGDLITNTVTSFSALDETSNINVNKTTGGVVSGFTLNTSNVSGRVSISETTSSPTINTFSQTNATFSNIKPIVGFSNSRSGITSDWTVVLPTSDIQENDIVVVGYARALANTAPTPSGWTLVGSATANDSYNSGMTVFYKRMGATPDATIALPNSNGNTSAAYAMCGYVFRGVDTTTALDVTYQTSSVSNSILVTPPSITPTTSGAMAVTFFAGGHNQGDVYLRSDGLGHVTPAGSDTWDIAAGCCFKEWSGSGAVSFAQVDATIPDGSIFSGASLTLALRPA
jgi:hypothetical protein